MAVKYRKLCIRKKAKRNIINNESEEMKRNIVKKKTEERNRNIRKFNRERKW